MSAPADPSPDTASTVASTDRRSVLKAGAALGALGAAAPLLAACGSDTTAAPSATTPAGDSAATPAAPAATGVIVAAADVPVGGSAVKIVDDRKVVVTQPAAGDFKAFSAVCTHAGCTVKGVEEGSILCVCHGSRFDQSTGAVLQGPAASPLAAIPVRVEGGQVEFA